MAAGQVEGDRQAVEIRLQVNLRAETAPRTSELWNAALAERIDDCRKAGKTITSYEQMKSLTAIRGEEGRFR